MTAEEDFAAREAAWKAAGSTDYNKMAETEPAILGSQWSSLIPEGFQSTNTQPFADVKKAGQTAAGQGTDVPVDPQTMSSHVPSLMNSNREAVGQQGDLFARLKQLTDSPMAVLSQIGGQLGIDPFGNGPYAQYLRSQANLLRPAYYLWQGGSDTGAGVDPNDYINFARQFLQSAGGNLGNKRQMTQQALGLQPGQSDNWSTLLNSGTFTPDQLQALVEGLYSIGNMGSGNPFDQYRGANIGNLLSKYQGQYGAGQMGLNPLYTDYLKQNLPSLLGW